MKLEIDCQPLEEDDDVDVMVAKAHRVAITAFNNYLGAHTIDSSQFVKKWRTEWVGVGEEPIESYIYEGR